MPLETGRSTEATPVTAKTPMSIGSVGKMTTFAVLQLVDQGLVQCDRPVSDQLPRIRAG